MINLSNTNVSLINGLITIHANFDEQKIEDLQALGSGIYDYKFNTIDIHVDDNTTVVLWIKSLYPKRNW